MTCCSTTAKSLMAPLPDRSTMVSCRPGTEAGEPNSSMLYTQAARHAAYTQTGWRSTHSKKLPPGWAGAHLCSSSLLHIVQQKPSNSQQPAACHDTHSRRRSCLGSLHRASKSRGGCTSRLHRVQVALSGCSCRAAQRPWPRVGSRPCRHRHRPLSHGRDLTTAACHAAHRPCLWLDAALAGSGTGAPARPARS